MNSADLLNALPGVTVLETVHSDLQSPPLWSVVLVGVAFGALFFSITTTIKSENILCGLISIVLAVVAVASSVSLIRQLTTLNWKEKYVIEIADDVPRSSMIVLIQNFRTVEVDGDTYTLVEDN